MSVLRGEEGTLILRKMKSLKKEHERRCETMAIKKSVWDMILKLIIVVISAAAGVLGANAMPL